MFFNGLEHMVVLGMNIHVVMPARKGYFEILKWSMDNGCPTTEWTCAEASIGGQFEVLKYLRSLDPPCPWNKMTCLYAKKLGYNDMLSWALESGCPPYVPTKKNPNDQHKLM